MLSVLITPLWNGGSKLNLWYISLIAKRDSIGHIRQWEEANMLWMTRSRISSRISSRVEYCGESMRCEDVADQLKFTNPALLAGLWVLFCICNTTAVNIIPALCGMRDKTTIAQALNQTCDNDLKYWEEENIPYTMQKKRQDFFSSGKA